MCQRGVIGIMLHELGAHCFCFRDKALLQGSFLLQETAKKENTDQEDLKLQLNSLKSQVLAYGLLVV